jgi:hypothetical protein
MEYTTKTEEKGKELATKADSFARKIVQKLPLPTGLGKNLLS